jgi:predicted nucleic acid-binding protein
LTIYVESNFVLEIALGQEYVSAAEAILARAERGEITLAVPWFSLAEPFSTVDKRSRDRKQFISQMKRQLQDLRRSQHRGIEVRTLELGTTRMTRIDISETDNLIRTVERILNAGTVISVDPQIFGRAMRDRTRFGLSPQDALVYASVIEHLFGTAAPGPHYFVTKDQDDFQDPGIARELSALSCELLFSFGDLALLLEQPPPA